MSTIPKAIPPHLEELLEGACIEDFLGQAAQLGFIMDTYMTVIAVEYHPMRLRLPHLCKHEHRMKNSWHKLSPTTGLESANIFLLAKINDFHLCFDQLYR